MKTARDKRESMPDSEAVRRVGYSVCELLDCCASWTLRWESYRTSEELRFRLEKAAKIDYTVGIGRFGCCGSPSRRRVPRDEPRQVHASAAWSRSEHVNTPLFTSTRYGQVQSQFPFILLIEWSGQCLISRSQRTQATSRPATGTFWGYFILKPA